MWEGYQDDQKDYHREIEWQEHFNGFFNLEISDRTTDKQRGAYRGRAQSQTKVENHDDAEMDRVYADAYCNRQEDRGKQEDQDSHVHEQAQYQHQDVDRNEDDKGIVGDGEEEIGHHQGHSHIGQ